jgi:NADH-quinone oxidoreductase subunit G
VRQKVTPPGTARADWMIAAELAFRLGGDLGLESVEQIRAELAGLSPLHAALVTDALAEREGTLVTGGSVTVAPRERTTPPKSDAYSFRLVATRSMYDLGTVLQHSPSSAHLAPGTAVLLHPADFDQLGLPAGARVTVTSTNASSSTASLRTIVQPDAGVPRGSAAMLFNQPDAEVGALLDARAAAIDVRVERA